MKYLLPQRERYYKTAMHVHTDVSDGFWSPEADRQMALAEIKGRGYDQQYALLLSRGWHVAPSFNEDRFILNSSIFIIFIIYYYPLIFKKKSLLFAGILYKF